MTTVNLLNGADHSVRDTIFAMRVLENLRACDIFAFTKFIDHCRQDKSQRDVKPAVRDVAQSSAVGSGLDMRLVHPVRLRQPQPGQRIVSMQDLWDLDLTQGAYIKLIDHVWTKAGQQFGRLWMRPPQLPDFALFAQIEMEDLGKRSALLPLEPRDFENGQTQVFIASPREIRGREFCSHGLAEKFSDQRAQDSRELTSHFYMYEDEQVMMAARFYCGLANSCL